MSQNTDNSLKKWADTINEAYSSNSVFAKNFSIFRQLAETTLQNYQTTLEAMISTSRRKERTLNSSLDALTEATKNLANSKNPGDAADVCTKWAKKNWQTTTQSAQDIADMNLRAAQTIQENTNRSLISTMDKLWKTSSKMTGDISSATNMTAKSDVSGWWQQGWWQQNTNSTTTKSAGTSSKPATTTATPSKAASSKPTTATTATASSSTAPSNNSNSSSSSNSATTAKAAATSAPQSKPAASASSTKNSSAKKTATAKKTSSTTTSTKQSSKTSAAKTSSSSASKAAASSSRRMNVGRRTSSARASR